MSNQNKNNGKINNNYNNNNNNNNIKDEDNQFFLFKDNNNQNNDIQNNFKPKTVISNVHKKGSNRLHQSYNQNLKNIDNNSEQAYQIINNNNKINDPKKLKELEEQKKIMEAEEKERNKIRDKLKCFICFGKATNSLMCIKCKAIACEECVQKMLLRSKICSNCKNSVTKQDFVNLPFMNDLASFFINNVEQKYISKKNNIKDNEINININNDFQKSNLDIEKNCEYHPNNKTEYICLTCNEYLCSECLIFLNKENVDKHSDHIILSNGQINEFNLKDTIKEYNSLYKKKLNFNKAATNYDLAIEEINIRKRRVIEEIKKIKNDLESKYSKKIEEIQYLLNLLKNKKKAIENGIKEFPNNFNKNIEENNVEKNKTLLNNLKSLNYLPTDKEEIEKKSLFQKNICLESFESDIIDFKLPNNGLYLEEAIVLNQDIKLIPNTPCKFKAQLLYNYIVLTLIIQINHEYYEKYHPTFFGYLIITSDKKCEYVEFNNYYNKGELILTIEFDFSKMKSLLNENDKCNLKCHITRNIFK